MDRLSAYCVTSQRWAAALAGCLLLLADGCSKARGDDFSRFKPSEHLIDRGNGTRGALRYRPGSSQDLVYQLAAEQTASSLRTRGRMRLRVAFSVAADARGAIPFKLRLLNILRLDPVPPEGYPDLGPTHVLLQGQLGPRGALQDLVDSTVLPSPVNLQLIAPLCLPRYPEAAIAQGARWRVANRHRWSRQHSADPQIPRSAYKSSTDVLLERHYELKKLLQTGDVSQVQLVAKVSLRLRSQSTVLGHRTRHTGRVKGTARYTVDRATGMPDQVQVSLTGNYELRANDQTRKAKQRITLTLTRER